MSKIKRNHKAYLWSAVAALVMTVAFYVAGNWPVPISKENSYMKMLGRTQRYIFDNTIPEDFLFINISYDRDLVDVKDEYGFSKGNTDITNRRNLADFLRIANINGDYRYIFLDVRFEDRLKSDYDSTLYELLATTPRLVVPIHEGMTISDGRIARKAGWADYHGTLSEGDFVKYDLGTEQHPSMVLKAYEELTGAEPRSWWRFAFSEGKPMRTSFIPVFYFNVTGPYDASGERQYYNLGSDLLTDPEGFERLLSDKYVFVGDFEDVDIHQTYQGYMPGSAIHANVLLNLMKGNHLVGYGTLVVMFLLFFVLNVAMVSDIPGLSSLKDPEWLKKRAATSKRWRTALVWWEWAYSFLGYGFIFSVVFLGLLFLVGQVYEVLVLSVVYLVLSRIANYIKNYKKK